MSTVYPVSIDDFQNPTATDTHDVISHSQQHRDANDAITALETKVGTDGSADPDSLDKRVSELEAAPGGGVTDHGELDGLADDDHAQYLNTARHDAHDHSTAVGTAALADLGDVAATAPNDGDVLTFDTTNGWQPEAVAGGSGALTKISETRLASATATVSFTSIPSTYTHLRLMVKARSDRAAANSDPWALRFNNDSGTNYAREKLVGRSAAASSATATGQTEMSGEEIPAASASTGAATQMVIDILDYADTTWHKTCMIHQVQRQSSTDMSSSHAAGHWEDTTAINRIDLITTLGQWMAGSVFSLYGVA